MKNSCIIKGNPNGIRLILDEAIPFEELLNDIQENVHNAAHFFKDAQIALSFEGRTLSTLEERRILDSIETNSDMRVACIIDENKERAALYRHTLKEKLLQMSAAHGNFYKGTLEFGQVLEGYKSIVIIGDVKKGAKIRCVGSITVIGTLEGAAHAGICGDEEAYVAAMNFRPEQLKIGSSLRNLTGKRYVRTGNAFTIATLYQDTIQIHSI
ncbi:MAG: septum site-determining protein MinC [Lachnospiraceae bacterium]|nr:septum site-determining protein MinC [Lachnospiraceae bacterium]